MVRQPPPPLLGLQPKYRTLFLNKPSLILLSHCTFIYKHSRCQFHSSRWQQKLENRGSLVDWRKGYSGRQITVSTPGNIALVLAEEQASHNNSPFDGAPTLRRNGLNIRRSTRHRILKKYLKFRSVSSLWMLSGKKNVDPIWTLCK